MTATEIYRTFFAIGLDADTEQCLRHYQTQLKKILHSKKIRWLKPENWHVTLRYLGNTQKEQIPRLINAVNNALKEQAPFTITLNNATFFPGNQHPRVLALIISIHEALLRLYKTVETIAVAEQFVAEKRAYRPHISIARLPTTISKNDEGVAAVEFKPINMLVKQLTLYQSITWPEGVEYKPLHRFTLPQHTAP